MRADHNTRMLFTGRKPAKALAERLLTALAVHHKNRRNAALPAVYAQLQHDSINVRAPVQDESPAAGCAYERRRRHERHVLRLDAASGALTGERFGFRCERE